MRMTVYKTKDGKWHSHDCRHLKTFPVVEKRTLGFQEDLKPPRKDLCFDCIGKYLNATPDPTSDKASSVEGVVQTIQEDSL